MKTIVDWLVPRAHAAINFNFLTPVQNSENNVSTIANNVINFVLIIAGIMAIVYLIYSGILYITAAGNPDAAKKGQQGVINAIIGIVIIVLAYFIARSIAGIGKGMV
ncbi:MAG: hypothetical protein WC451_03940 [Patescibacteria group bacterium]|jgi:membrane-anchored glycerophosphoryl diester phosphodiesterase (GDPDase)